MDRGDLWIPKAEFFNAAGEPTDPSTVTVLVRAPDGEVDTRGPYPGDQGGSDLERVSEGVFTSDVVLASSGEWNVRWEGTGDAQAASPDQSVDVADSVFYPGYRLLCSVDSVVKELKLTDKEPDRERIEQTIEAASEAIIMLTGRDFYPAPAEPSLKRYLAGSAQFPDGSAYLAIGDAAEVEEVASQLDETYNGSLVWSTLPSHRDEARQPLTAIAFNLCPGDWVDVTARWGWPLTPPDVREAAIKQAAAWYGLDSSRLADSWGDELAQAGAVLQQSGGGRSLLKVARDLKSRYGFAKLV